jgi:hypothetical protein
MNLARKWCVLLAARQDGSLQVSVWADDTLLMPTTSSRPPVEILNCLIAALVDFREGDEITAVIHGSGPLTAWTGTNPHLAMHWMATALMNAWWPAVSERTSPSFAEAPATGVRSKAPCPRVAS